MSARQVITGGKPQYPWEQEQQPQPGIGPTNPQQQVEQVTQPQQQQMGREEWRDAWMGQGQMTPQEADQWLSSHGATQMQGGEKAGRWVTPHGEALDLQIGRSGALANGGKITAGWTSMGGGGSAPQSSGGGLGPSWSSMTPSQSMQQPVRQGARPMMRRKQMSPYRMTQGVNPRGM